MDISLDQLLNAYREMYDTKCTTNETCLDCNCMRTCPIITNAGKCYSSYRHVPSWSNDGAVPDKHDTGGIHTARPMSAGVDQMSEVHTDGTDNNNITI